MHLANNTVNGDMKNEIYKKFVSDTLKNRFVKKSLFFLLLVILYCKTDEPACLVHVSLITEKLL